MGFPIVLFYQYNIASMTLISIIYFEFKAWNMLLIDHLKKDDKISISKDLKLMRLSAIFHYKLCEALDAFSSLFFLSMMTFFFECFYMFLLTLFNMLAFVLNPSSSAAYFSVLTSCWCLQYVPFILWMTSFASFIKNEGKAMGNLVDQLYMRDKGCIGRKQRAFAFTLQSAHSSPIIYCSIFPLDWKLLFDILYGVFNYFIILIQMYDVSE